MLRCFLALLSYLIVDGHQGYEFFDQAWASAKNRSSNLAKFLKFNEKLVNWVADIILSQTSIDLRAAMVAHLISIARVSVLRMSFLYGIILTTIQLRNSSTCPISRGWWQSFKA